MPREYRFLRRDVLECAQKVRRHTGGVSFGGFRDDELLRDAVLRNLEISGEAARVLPDEVKLRHPEVDWRGIVGLRTLLAHIYFAVELETIWQLVEEKVPELSAQRGQILEREQ